jgi:RHS repeat-associated protein
MGIVSPALAETGLNQNWRRDYDAGLGRYIESDPIGLLAGTNIYRYVSNRPISQVDFQGLSDILIDIERTICSATGILGNITLVIGGESVLTYNTLELPWLANANSISAVPNGTYESFIRNSPANGTVVELRDVPNRARIQIHKGNFTKDTEGCVLIGGTIGSTSPPTISKSAEAFDTFMRSIAATMALDTAAGVVSSINVRISGCEG